jgi:methylase of polypeptide subunit release factors
MWKETLAGAISSIPQKIGQKRVLDIGTSTGIWAIEYGQ